MRGRGDNVLSRVYGLQKLGYTLSDGIADVPTPHPRLPVDLTVTQ